VYPALIVKHYCVEFGDPSGLVFLDTEKQTRTQTNEGTKPAHVIAIGLGNKTQIGLKWLMQRTELDFCRQKPVFEKHEV